MTDPQAATRGSVVLEGMRYLVRHPLRTFLTSITCAVAIAVTVNVISLSYGLEEDIQRDVSRFGRLTVDVGRLPIIMPGATRAALGEAELRKVQADVADLGAIVVPRRQLVGRAEGDAAVERLQVVAAPTAYLSTLGVDVIAGRWLTTRDSDGRAGPGHCALDADTARQLFPGVSPPAVVGRTIRLSARDYDATLTVVGVLEDPLTYRALFESFDEGRGARTLTSSLLSFRNVYVRASALPGAEFTGISIALPNDAAVDVASKRLTRHWPEALANLDEFVQAGIGVFVRRNWMEALGGSTATGAMVSNIIWIIIVLVAVVMISTLNLITIRERYDELAVRRCEGARRRDIALQITAEGVFTSLLGGLAGLPLGYAGAAVLRDIVDFPFRFNPAYAGVATIIAAVIGLLAAVVPARRAATLQPARVLSRRLT